MSSSTHVRLRRLPSGWGSYPRVLLNRRPPVTEVRDPPEFSATVTDVELSERSVAAYASVCGFSEGVPATYPHVLAMPLHLEIFALRDFPLRPMGLIHLSNVIEGVTPMRTGMRLDVTVSAQNYQRTDAGLAFDMATEITSDGLPVWRETCVFLSRWPEPVERTGARPPRPPKAPKDSSVLAEIDVTRGVGWAYARAARDINPIHLSDRAARFFGLRGAIAHGMWSLARSLAQQPAPEIPLGSRIDTQFLTPVQLPARVAIKEWTADGQRRRAMCDIRTGRVHMYAYWAAAPAAV